MDLKLNNKTEIRCIIIVVFLYPG